MHVTVSHLAEADIETITDFIAADNPIRALSFAKELLKACLDLADIPFRFAQLEDYEALGYRRRIYERYSIIYQVNGAEVVIVRIISSAMDVDSALGQN